VEGKFYVWDRAEVISLLGDEEGRVFCALYDVTTRGNFEHRNILNLPREPEDVAADFGLSVDELEEMAARGRRKLFAAREPRVRPGRDEKVLSGWNGWMLAAVAEAALAFDRPDWREMARRNADFLIGTMMEGERIFRSFKDGQRKIGGLLEDYSGAAWGLLAAFEVLQDRRYLDAARALAGQILSRFADRENGGFFDTPDDHERLIARPKDLFDNATPSGNSIAADVLLRLALQFGEPEYQRAARSAIEAIWPIASRYPSGFGYYFAAAEWLAGKPKEIVITGDAPSLWRVVGEEYLPHRVLAGRGAVGLPLMEGRDPTVSRAYVCEGYVCQEPAEDAEALRRQLATRDRT
jgi:uncharacterized protein YyaL (SSP411 family)